MSDNGNEAPWSGPIEESEWPTRVRGHVVDTRGEPRIHGYEVAGDLAPNYGFAAVTLLSLTGELPGEPEAAAFEEVLVHAAPVSVREAPAHAAGLARLVGASSSSVLQVGVIGLAERAWFVVSAHRAFLAWLAAPNGPVPASAIGEGDATRVDGLRNAMARANLHVPALDHALAWDAAILACLYRCGLQQSHQLEAVLVLAGLPVVVAEARSWGRGRFREYPMNTPTLRYERIAHSSEGAGER